MPDSRHLALPGEGGLPVLLDRSSGRIRGLGSHDIEGEVDGERLGLSRNGRTALLRSDILESNVWLLTFPEDAEGSP